MVATINKRNDISVQHAHDSLVPIVDQWVGSWKISLESRAPSVQDLKRSYDDKADGWSKAIRRLGTVEGYRGVVAALNDRHPELSLSTRPKVLDCGVGDGAFSSAFCAHRDTPPQLTGIDISPQMLDAAGRHLGARGVSADLRLGDVRDLPFGDNEFDLILCGHVLEHLPSPERALRELYRVLKPGGHLVLVATKRSMWTVPIRLRWRVRAYSATSLRQTLRHAGLINVRIAHPTEGSRFAALSVACLATKPFPRLPAPKPLRALTFHGA